MVSFFIPKIDYFLRQHFFSSGTFKKKKTYLHHSFRPKFIPSQFFHCIPFLQSSDLALHAYMFPPKLLHRSPNLFVSPFVSDSNSHMSLRFSNLRWNSICLKIFQPYCLFFYSLAPPLGLAAPYLTVNIHQQLPFFNAHNPLTVHFLNDKLFPRNNKLIIFQLKLKIPSLHRKKMPNILMELTASTDDD